MACRATADPADEAEAWSSEDADCAPRCDTDWRSVVCCAVRWAAARESGESCLIDEGGPAPELPPGGTEEVAAAVGCAAGATARFAEASCGETAVSPVAGGSWSPIRPCVAM